MTVEDITNMASGIMPELPSGGDIFAMLEEKIISLLPAGILTFYESNKTLFLLGSICVLLLLAVQGYKLFKMLMYAGSAFLFAYIGLNFLAPKIPANILSFVPQSVKADMLVAILCALIAVFLTRCAYNFMIMLLGGVAGYFLGAKVLYGMLIEHFHTLEFLKFDFVPHVVGGVIAVIFAILFILLFKHLFMLISSFGGSVAAGLILQSLVMPDGGTPIKIAFAVLGGAFGIYCIVHQYKEEEKDMEIVF